MDISNCTYNIPLFVAIPLGGAFLISLLGKKIKSLPDIIGFVFTIGLFVMSLISISVVSNLSVVVYRVGGWVPPIGSCMVLAGLSSFMLVTVNLISFLVLVYSLNYIARYTDKWKFYTLFLLMIAGMNGSIVSGDLFNLFV